MKRHTFAFQFTGGELCLDFANTVNLRPTAEPIDRLDSYEALLSWAAQAGILRAPEVRDLHAAAEQHPGKAEHALRRAKELREAIFRAMAAIADGKPPAGGEVEILNSFLAPAMSQSRLWWDASAGKARWRMVDDAGALDRVLWPIAQSAADLLLSERTGRVRRCRGEDCDWLFLDNSKNQTRQWCKMATCGNRAKVSRYRERLAEKA